LAIRKVPNENSPRSKLSSRSRWRKSPPWPVEKAVGSSVTPSASTVPSSNARWRSALVLPQYAKLTLTLVGDRPATVQLTVTEKPRRGSPYPPRTTLRTDLLGEAAGAVLGSPPGEGYHQDQNRGRLLLEAGADPDVTERARRERAERAARSGPPFSRSPSADPRIARPR